MNSVSVLILGIYKDKKLYGFWSFFYDIQMKFNEVVTMSHGCEALKGNKLENVDNQESFLYNVKYKMLWSVCLSFLNAGDGQHNECLLIVKRKCDCYPIIVRNL